MIKSSGPRTTLIKVVVVGEVVAEVEVMGMEEVTGIEVEKKGLSTRPQWLWILGCRSQLTW
jgi:hypothetical protein